MQLSRLIACVGVTLSAVAAIAATHPANSLTRPAEAEAEVRRIQIHLDSSLNLLETDDTRGLSSAQRDRRSSAIRNLRTYRDRGTFPHNYDFERMTPYFVDRKTGTLCAVAYLLASTGREDIVSRVAHANNNARVRDLAGDTAFTNWLGENGLSLDEAAFIQVVYAAQPNYVALGAAAVGTLAFIPTIGTGLWNVSSNSDGHRLWVSRIGFVTSLVSLGAGAQLLASRNRDFDPNATYAKTNMIIGGAGAALAIRAMTHHSRVVAKERETSRRTISDAAVSPIVSSDRSRTGLAVSLRF